LKKPRLVGKNKKRKNGKGREGRNLEKGFDLKGKSRAIDLVRGNIRIARGGGKRGGKKFWWSRTTMT